MGRYALLVGSSGADWEDPLGSIEGDLARVQTLLSSDICGFVVTGSVLNEACLNVKERLEEFFREAGRADELLLYLSGHGHCSGSGTFFLHCNNSDDSVPHSTMVPGYALRELVRESSARAVTIVVDACRSETLAENVTAKASQLSEAVTSALRGLGEGICVLTSCSSIEKSYEMPGADSEVFSIYTSALCHVIQQGIAANDGRATAIDIHDTARRYVDYISTPSTRQDPSMSVLRIRHGGPVLAFYRQPPPHKHVTTLFDDVDELALQRALTPPLNEANVAPRSDLQTIRPTVSPAWEPPVIPTINPQPQLLQSDLDYLRQTFGSDDRITRRELHTRLNQLGLSREDAPELLRRWQNGRIADVHGAYVLRRDRYRKD